MRRKPAQAGRRQRQLQLQGGVEDFASLSGNGDAAPNQTKPNTSSPSPAATRASHERNHPPARRRARTKSHSLPIEQPPLTSPTRQNPSSQYIHIASCSPCHKARQSHRSQLPLPSRSVEHLIGSRRAKS